MVLTALLGTGLIGLTIGQNAHSLQLKINDLVSKRVLVLGDSITHAGEYVSFIEYGLNVAYPKAKFDWINVGLPSETASGLSESVHPFPRPCVHERLWAALDSTKPDVVFACYGINDGIYHPFSHERFQAFQKGIKRLLEVNHAAGVKTVLLTPPPFDAKAAGASVRPVMAPDFSWMNAYENYDDVMKAYSEWELTLGAPDVQVIDLHHPIADYVNSKRSVDPKFSLSGDGVHVNSLGHWIMAQTVLSELGVRAKQPQATDPLYKLIDERRRLREDAWLPYIGYTRDGSFKTWSIDAAERKAAGLSREISRIKSQ